MHAIILYVPPLEDMSEILEQRDKLKERKNKDGKTESSRAYNNIQNGTNEPNLHSDGANELSANKEECVTTTTDPKSSTDKTQSCENTSVSNKHTVSSSKPKPKESSGFGGFSKGFLFGGPPKSKPQLPASKPSSQSDTKSSEKLDDIPFIKGEDQQQHDRLNMPEVQEAMKPAETLMKNTEWVTDDLLTKIQKNATLSKRMTDPSFIQAIGEFQNNPQSAMIKYQNNIEMQKFFKEFCGIMGEHFSGFDEMQPATAASNQDPGIRTKSEDGADMRVRSSTDPNQATAADEEKMQEILSNPSVREILMDPQIQNLFTTLRSDPEEGQRVLQTADGHLKQKIEKLVESGLLQFQT